MNGSLLDELMLIGPMAIPAIGGLIILLADVLIPNFGKARWSFGGLSAIFLLGGIAPLFTEAAQFQTGATVFSGLVYADQFGFLFSLLILAGAVLALLLGMDAMGWEGIESRAEFYSLYLMAVAGAVLFVNAAELITLFLGLEIMSMALYCLCGAAVKSRRSAESALKYFLLGSFSSAFLLYGIALLYGLTGTTFMVELEPLLVRADPIILLVAVGLILVGLAFKVGLVPFHFWVPDVYQGAPTPVTAFMACVIKAAAVGATLRVMWGLFGDQVASWSGAVWYLAFFTMTVGNLIALRQRSVKRMLAYSSVAHAGYMAVALLAPSGEFGGGPAIVYYLVGYTLMTLGSFGVVQAISAGAKHPGEDDIARMHGLGYTRPLLAAMMTLFMLSLAGIPPGMAGLLGKFYIFSAAVRADYWDLAIIGVVNSAVSAYYYLRVIVALYFIEPGEHTSQPPVALGVGLMGVLVVCAAGVVLFGIFPSSVVETAGLVFRQLQH